MNAPADPSPPRFVVGIGASAGGLEALERFFDSLPKSTGMAFVIVQHLSPDFKSLMDELLARHTELPIRLVEDGVRIEPDHVYLIPPKKEMIISGGRLLLSERDHQQELSLPIDVFFRSLAQDCGTRAIAIVLSGGGSDGSRGIRDVYEAGGLVIVQDVESAQFDGMPKTARDAGVAHWVLAPHEMPRVLIDHAARPPTQAVREPIDHTNARDGLDAVYRMLEDEFGIDFNHYKPSTVTRRIERRIQLALDGDIGEYVDRLKRERNELDMLYRDLLIGVTRFFRNEEAFAVLEQRVLPDLFRRGARDAPLRVWVAGCATGEEAYSLAILLHEAAARFGDRPVKIFASDVHRGSLEIAARGVYEGESIANVSEDRLQRYFIERGRSYQVVPEIRQTIVFAPHNVIRDAPFTRIDLVSCRNLLIYLQPAAQQKALSLFHFGLNRGGIVFLGPSESPGVLLHDFETIDKHWRIFRKHRDVRTPVDPRQLPRVEPKFSLVPALQAAPARHSLAHMLGTYDSLLDRFMPPSLLVSDRGELLHVFGGASRFLRHRDGRQSPDLVDAVDSELKMVLVGGLKRALVEPSGLVFKGVRILADGEDAAYRVTISPVTNRSGAPPNLLVSFEKMDPASTPALISKPEIDVGGVPHAQIAALEAELNSTRENLQAAIEELETSNEEMQTANEELHASNEELQSTNEELQSVNEELYSVNAEYQRKIAELTELTNDMDNLLSSTDIGTIFLNRELKVRKFTPQIAQAFNLLPQDVGRSIETFTHNIDHPELVDDLRRVLASGERIERELQDREGRSFFLRVLPYRAKGTIDGVVVTLIDMTSLKAAEDALFHERYLLNSMLAAVPDAIYFKDARGRFIRANDAVAAQFGLTDPRALAGKSPFELTDHARALAMHQDDERVLRSAEAQPYRLEKRVNASGASGGGEQWVVATRHPLFDRSEQPVGVVTVLRDVTKQKRAEEKIQEAVRRRDQFLAMLSHELRNPLGAVVTATALAKAASVSDPGLSRLIKIIDRQSQQMARLLDDLLEASRVTQNKIELRKCVVDLVPIVKEAADAVRNTMDSHGLTFVLEVDSQPMFVSGDPARLQQLQVNLLNNAAKYTPRGGHVSLTARPEGEFAVIRVRDDGVGIPPTMLDEVFELFVQSERTLDRANGGLGVGLTLVRSLVTLHGGTVTAHSDGEGKGSEFVVRLPRARHMPEEVSSTRLRPRVRKGSRILVVEDNADSRAMLCQLLALAGCEAYSAEAGPQALELLDEVRPDVAILDLGLPGMDGYELAQRIRANPKYAHVYLIALTGYGQASDRARALQAGFHEHVVKPIGPETLVKLLSSGMEQQGETASDPSAPSRSDAG